MKKILITLAIFSLALGALGQGTINFANYISGGVLDARVTDKDGVNLAGDNYFAQLYAGPQGGQMTAVGAVTTFRTGSGAGVFYPVNNIAVPGIATGVTATVQARAWEGPATSYEAAGVKGASNAFDVVLGDPGTPPNLPSPATMEGLESFAIIPEPSTIALGILGALGLLALRRRK